VKTNLWRLYNLATGYGQRPSEILGLQTALGAWSLDEACLIAGRRIEKALNEGKDPFMAEATAKGYRSAKGSKAIKKVKMKKNGTW
jgi:hypothetical protein